MGASLSLLTRSSSDHHHVTHTNASDHSKTSPASNSRQKKALLGTGEEEKEPVWRTSCRLMCNVRQKVRAVDLVGDVLVVAGSSSQACGTLLDCSCSCVTTHDCRLFGLEWTLCLFIAGYWVDIISMLNHG